MNYIQLEKLGEGTYASVFKVRPSSSRQATAGTKRKERRSGAHSTLLLTPCSFPSTLFNDPCCLLSLSASGLIRATISGASSCGSSRLNSRSLDTGPTSLLLLVRPVHRCRASSTRRHSALTTSFGADACCDRCRPARLLCSRPGPALSLCFDLGFDLRSFDNDHVHCAPRHPGIAARRDARGRPTRLSRSRRSISTRRRARRRLRSVRSV